MIYLNIYDRNRARVAVCENAFGMIEDEKINGIAHLTFKLPYNDPKNAFCKPFYYVRYGQTGALYRIMPSALDVGEDGTITYTCEHVLATLIDNVLYGSHIVGNLSVYTADCIRYILARQKVQNWVLYRCDFARQFEYAWEQETLLSALFSVATPLSDYMWVTDTTVYPWRLSLVSLSSGAPELYVRYRHNLHSLNVDTNPEQICTRLYPLGYGEGINQLTIESVNNGVPYIQSPPSVVAQYGIVERVWIDRRYESAESLLAAAKKMLAELQEPVVAYEISLADLPGQEPRVGQRVRILRDDTGTRYDTRITRVRRVYGDYAQSTVEVRNRDTDIANTIADMADRQRIEQSYAQGATQVYAQSVQANCDKDTGAVLHFYIPSELRIINKVLIKFKAERFRAYSKATESGGSVMTSSSGGGSTSSTALSGTTATGGGGAVNLSIDVDTTSEGETLYSQNIEADDQGGLNAANHNHGIAATRDTGLYLGLFSWGSTAPAEWHGWTPSGAHIHGAHAHRLRFSRSINLPSHSHNLSLGHSHQIYAHTHTLDTKHTHAITPGIYRYGSPASLKIYVNGTLRGTLATLSGELDITQYLVSSGTIPRGIWHSVEIRPDDLAYVSIDMYVQGFVQSRGDNTV